MKWIGRFVAFCQGKRAQREMTRRVENKPNGMMKTVRHDEMGNMNAQHKIYIAHNGYGETEIENSIYREMPCSVLVSSGIGVHRCWWDSNAMWKRLWKLNSLHDSRVSLHADTFFLTNVQSGSIQIHKHNTYSCIQCITHIPREWHKRGEGEGGGGKQVKEDKLRRGNWIATTAAVMEWNEVNVLMMTRWWAITYGTFSSFVRCELYTYTQWKRNHRRTRELMNKRQGYNGSE